SLNGGLFRGEHVVLDEGVDDRVELAAGRVVGEDDLRELRPVQRPVFAQHAGTEGLGDPREARRAWFDDRAGGFVSAQEARAVRGEPTARLALARSDPASQPD